MLDLIKLKTFYKLGSTASRLFLLFTTKFPEIPGTFLIDLGRMKGWVDLGAIQWFCGDHVYTCEKWHCEVNLRQLARNFEARKILFKNVSRHIRMLVTWPNTIFSKTSIWTEMLIANLVAGCGKAISGSCNIQIPKADWLEVVIMYIGNFQELKGWSSHLWESHSFRFYYEGVLNKKNLLTNLQKQIIILVQALAHQETKNLGCFLWGSF